MKLDGRQATTGTIVVNAGQRGEIDLPWGVFALVFNPTASHRNVSLSTNTKEIVFDGTDNSLGLATTLNLPLSSGNTATLTLAVYTIGDGDSATRVVHYTAA